MRKQILRREVIGPLPVIRQFQLFDPGVSRSNPTAAKSGDGRFLDLVQQLVLALLAVFRSRNRPNRMFATRQLSRDLGLRLAFDTGDDNPLALFRARRP